MHVVFVADRVKPRLGMEKALESLLERLTHDRVELVVIAGPEPGNAPYRVTALDCPPGWRGRLLALPELRKIAIARSEAGAVIIAVGAWAFAALAAATVLSGFKLTLWEHSILPWRLRHEWRVSVAAVALRLFAFRLERVICVSESNCAAVGRIVWPLRELAVIPNVIAKAPSSDLPIRGDAGLGDVVSLVGIGSLTQRKNWELAVRAMTCLPDNYRLEIAGAGDQHDRLSALIDQLGLRTRVRLLGYVPDAYRLMRAADIVVHPSLAETFGYTMIEASQEGRPIVVTDMPVMNEMVPHFACGERAGLEPTLFAEAIITASSATYDFARTARAREDCFGDRAVLNSWTLLIPGLQQ